MQNAVIKARSGRTSPPGTLQENLASTVQTLRGYNESYGYCTENELAHIWYLDNVAGVKPETRAKLDAIMGAPNISKEQKLRMAYAELEKDLPDEERTKLLADKGEIDSTFAQKKSVPADESVKKGKTREKHQRIIKRCFIPKYFSACVSKGETIPFNKETSTAVNKSLGTQVDIEFVVRHENGKDMGSASRGYIPWGNGAEQNASGVTIGAGFDLGANGEKELQNMGIAKDSPLYNKLKPYLGLKKQDACDKLAADMLAGTAPILTADEVALIDKQVFKDKLSAFQKAWDKVALEAKGKKFAELDPKVQTALFSRFYHAGSGKLGVEQSIKLAAIKGDLITVQKKYDEMIMRVNSSYQSRLRDEKKLITDAWLDMTIKKTKDLTDMIIGMPKK